MNNPQHVSSDELQHFSQADVFDIGYDLGRWHARILTGQESAGTCHTLNRERIAAYAEQFGMFATFEDGGWQTLLVTLNPTIQRTP